MPLFLGLFLFGQRLISQWDACRQLLMTISWIIGWLFCGGGEGVNTVEICRLSGGSVGAQWSCYCRAGLTIFISLLVNVTRHC
jgi:hypothetical protein